MRSTTRTRPALHSLRRGTILAGALLLSGPALTGCGGPQVSGFPILNSRTVRVGETVEVRLPATAERQWRMTRYDSVYLAPLGQPELAASTSGQTVTWRFQARIAGETQLEMREILARGATGTPKTKTIDVTIVE